MKQPPPEISAPIVQVLHGLYKELYQTGKKVPKRDRFGLYAQVEAGALKCLTLSIEAALAEPPAKIRPIKELRLALAVSKRLIRLCQELEVIEEKKYFFLQEKVVEASKMAAGWLAYMERKKSPAGDFPS